MKRVFPVYKCRHFLNFCNKQLTGSSDFMVAQHALRHTDDMAQLSLEQLSGEAHLSQATVSRFFRKAGFDNFSQFKIEFERFLLRRRANRNIGILRRFMGQSDEAVAQQLYEQALANLDATRRSLNFEQLYHIVTLMRSCEAIYFIGDSHELYCFLPLQIDLLGQGHSAYLIDINDMETGLIDTIPQDSLVCLLSVSTDWHPDELDALSHAARHRGIPVVMFSQDELPAGMEVDLCLRYGCPKTEKNGYYSLPLLNQLLGVMLYRDS